VTRAGCNAICPSFGSKCEGCRGVVNDEVIRTAGINLREQYDVNIEDVLADLQMFGAYQERSLP
jgi:sulfhydrogenase subunit delta